MHSQAITETFLHSRNRIVSGFDTQSIISPTLFISVIGVLNKLTLIREHHKGLNAIGGPALNYLGPPHVVIPVLL